MHTLATIALLTLLPHTALAQDAVRIEVTRAGLVDGPLPTLVIHADQALSTLSVSVDCGASSARHEGALVAGSSLPLPLPGPIGKHRCTGALEVVLADGTEGSLPLAFDIERVAQLAASVPAESLDLAGGSLVIQTDRPLREVLLVAHGEHGELLRSKDVEAVDGGARVHWTAPAEEILRLELLATDTLGFAARVEFFPWSYTVPHEDVVFESNQAAVRPQEVPKLEEAWGRVQAVVSRYGAVAAVNLYVAGFTDTVGDPASNQRLSEARARAIASWFRQRGFPGAIHYQGFGERGLAVPTPDSVDEEANRRVDYIIAADAPPESPTLPGSAWRPL